MILVVNNVSTKAIIGEKDKLAFPDVFSKLRNYLKVRPDGYQYAPSYKMKRWDGWKYFITSSGAFATGFLPLVHQFLVDEFKGLEIVVEDKRVNLPAINKTLDLDLPNGWSVRDYQVDMIKKINNMSMGLYFPRGVIDAATNAGKNSICAGLFNNVQNPRLLFLLHSKEIFRQAVDFFGEMFPTEIGQIGGGKFQLGNFTIAMVKTLFNQLLKSLNVRKEIQKFNILIVDEAHKAGGAEYSKVLQMIDAGMRVFVSGTPLNNINKVNNMIVVGLSGPVLGKVSNKELIEGGYSLKPKVQIFLNDTKGSCLTYKQELRALIHYSDKRAKMIADICVAKDGKKILISFIELKHGWFLKKVISEHPKFFGRIEMVHGQDVGRSYKIEDFKKGKIDVLLTSIILKEGVNIPNIEVLIMAHGGKSVITTKQFVGRALRTDDKNSEVEIIDFYDVGKYISPHSRKRLKIYRDEGFDVKVHYEEKRNKPVKYLHF